MSRIGKQPIELPQGVKATIAGQAIKIQGPKGTLEREVRPEIKVEMVDGKLVFTRMRDDRFSRAFISYCPSCLN